VRNKFVCAAVFSAAAALSAPASAQSIPDEAEAPPTYRVRIGPIAMNPRIQLANLGVDDNVFNEPTDQNPKKDFTLTITPSTDMWMRMGPSRLLLNVKEDLVWFRKYDSERSANSSYNLDWLLPLNRLRVDLSPKFLTTRDRPGYEIDARSQRRQYGGVGTIELRAFPRTFIGVTGSTERVDFDSVAVFDGVNLREALNRTVQAGGVAVRHQLTPLTTIGVSATREQSRFEFSPLRDSDSTSIFASVTFDPFALIKGSAKVGYRNFHPLSPGLPDFTGLTASGDLSYTLLGATRFSVNFTRDVQYSYEINQPYYLQTGAGGSITQQIFGPFDVMARGGAQRLAYRDRAGVFVATENRTDHVTTFGGGVGYHFGRDVRWGLNVDQYHRTSDLTARQYDALRYGTSVTYGF